MIDTQEGKFRPEELRRHKEQWLEICRTRPEIFTAKFSSAEVGSLQALIDELEFNAEVATRATPDRLGCLFQEEQFRKAISAGSIATLQDELKRLIVHAYAAIGRANQCVAATAGHTGKSDPLQESSHRASASITASADPINKALTALMKFLQREE